MNNIDRLVSEIVDIVNERQGCKAVELAAAINWESYENVLVDDLTTALERAITSGQIIAVNYVLAKIPYRSKSFLLPANTTVSLMGNGEQL